jgi:hypothetical protein
LLIELSYPKALILCSASILLFLEKSSSDCVFLGVCGIYFKSSWILRALVYTSVDRSYINDMD